MTELNATAASLLGFLHDGPKTGWDLLQEIDAGFRHFWNVTSSHVYRELKGLHERGYIQPEERSARDRQPYSITDEGRLAFAEWLAREPGGETMRIPLLVTLWFGDRLEPSLLREFLANHRKVNEERLERYRTAPADRMAADPYFAAVVEFGIAYEEAVLRWMDRLNDLPGLSS
ncbi:helix-turn-helix transcriptional regulator [Pseudonocardia eucalypti]|uniref:Helix-turn-helix transcriptional regulator n=1 Tax=Pseudonocardia eucalypti TaxID=648755 RepID=A0ABP9QQ84_9PSEU|nr:DNA-binding PadR family transcriptional regulator [Pseudonocardia eucalypti]